MKIARAVVAEQLITVEVLAADLLGLLPPKVRKMVEAGATFEASVAIPSAGFEAGDKMMIGADVPVMLSVFVRSQPKVK